MKRFLGLALLLASAALTACSGGSSSSTPRPRGSSFSVADLAGDWTGVFVPANPARDSFNFYVRFDAAGSAFEGADGLGDQWQPADSVFASNVDRRGNALVNLEQTAEMGVRMRLLGALDGARSLLRGEFALSRPAEADVEGSFELHKSSGPGHFTVAAHLAGSWLGYGAGQGNHRKDIRLELGADGSVLGGDMEVHVFIAGGVNTGIFRFSNDAVGRIDDVLIQSTDGSLQTVDYLLVDEAGTLLGGPGMDSTLGNGLARLARP